MLCNATDRNISLNSLWNEAATRSTGFYPRPNTDTPGISFLSVAIPTNLKGIFLLSLYMYVLVLQF